ncbi:ParB N-terminal domain-containing protein [Mesorhizobium sp. M0292]|uniref:ParB N-terminal domain-containing protein n=1 Tax=Mesorhizobium sp. M0292 TaxID=2956929 RepID=UPI00333594D4
MASKNLKIDQLKLDLLNPRIGKVDDQHAAMQAMADEQGVKLANLAESIVDEGGLNPMDVLLVLKDADGRYIALEGNRRTLALKLLTNPAAMTGLAIPSATQKRIEAASKRFDKATVEPVRCFEVADRAAAATWIDQRHRGEDEGRVSYDGHLRQVVDSVKEILPCKPSISCDSTAV